MAAAWRRDEHGLGPYDDLIRTCVDQHGGYVLSTAGDSFAIAFETAGAAVETAVTAQHRLQTERWPAVCELFVRMGIEVG